MPRRQKDMTGLYGSTASKYCTVGESNCTPKGSMARSRQNNCAGRERSEIQKQDHPGPKPKLRPRKNRSPLRCQVRKYYGREKETSPQAHPRPESSRRRYRWPVTVIVTSTYFIFFNSCGINRSSEYPEGARAHGAPPENYKTFKDRLGITTSPDLILRSPPFLKNPTSHSGIGQYCNALESRYAGPRSQQEVGKRLGLVMTGILFYPPRRPLVGRCSVDPSRMCASRMAAHL